MNLITFLHITLESGFALFCLLAVLSIRMYDTGTRKATNAIIACLLMNTVINIADALAYVYRGDPTNTGYLMVRVSNFVVFTGMFVLLALGNNLLDALLEEKGAGEDKKQRNYVYGLCGTGVALVAISAFFGFLGFLTVILDAAVLPIFCRSALVANWAAVIIWEMVSAFSLASCLDLRDWDTKARTAATRVTMTVV